MNFQKDFSVIFLKNFGEYLFANVLFTPQDKILVAVSGGVDSVVLLDVIFTYFQKNNATPADKIAIVHCNFQLRGQESEGDEALVKSLSEKYQLPIFCKRFETAVFAEENKLSIQVAARQLRYEWFAQLLKVHHFQYLATAHHLNDSIETVLYNLAKGTGIAGLHGILPKQGNIIRPLLCFSKEQVMQYALDNQLVWREDSSNELDKYSRNLIRHQVTPILKQINPNLEETFKDTLFRIRAVEQIFQEEVKKFKEKTITINIENDSYYLDIQVIKNEKENLIKLHEILKDFGFNFTQNKLIINNLDREAGKLFTSATHTLLKDRTMLIISPLENKIQYEIEKKIIEKTPDFQYSNEPNKAYLDYDRVGEGLVLRLWQEGDRFQPLGMKGKSKNVSDLLNDLKVPLHLKKQTYVLVSQGEIAWVVGYRLSEKFKVTQKTKTILELVWKRKIDESEPLF